MSYQMTTTALAKAQNDAIAAQSRAQDFLVHAHEMLYIARQYRGPEDIAAAVQQLENALVALGEAYVLTQKFFG